MPQPLKQLLGLCQRAGQLASGEVAVEQAIKKGKAHLMLLAEDASERTQERLLFLAERAQVAVYQVGSRDELSDAVGKDSYRAALVVQSPDFAKGILKILHDQGLTPHKGRG